MNDRQADGTTDRREDETEEPGYANILVPTDGSNLALRALEEALTIAGLTDGTIHVLYVVDDATIAELATDAGHDVSFDADVSRLFDRFEAEGERALDQIRDAAARRGVDVRSAMRKGIPHEEVIAHADENEIDLIVMGTHGRRGVSRYILGSTTERVLRRAPVPVLAVRDDDDGR